jgi:hypothetical protein
MTEVIKVEIDLNPVRVTKLTDLNRMGLSSK